MAEKKIGSVIPIYGFGAALLIYSVLFPMYELLHYILALCVSIVVYAVLKRLFPGKTAEVIDVSFGKTGDRDADLILAAGKAFIEKMYDRRGGLQDIEIRGSVDEIIKSGEKIYGFVSKNPDSRKKIRSFSEYYVPQTEKLVDSYIELSASGSSDESIKNTIGKIKDTMPSIIAAFNKQVANLYEDKAFDIRTDIKVLEGVLRDDGIRGEQ
jgi:hypothetical protein